MTTYNVYGDESCHLEHDGKPIMVLGAIWAPLDTTRQVATDLRSLKESYGHSPQMEIKWTKVSPGGIGLYRSVIDYFFENSALKFRAILVAGKDRLRHEEFRQTHNAFYYKLYYLVFDQFMSAQHSYRVYLDIKDTRSQSGVRELTRVLRSSRRDTTGAVIDRLELVRSHQVEQLQLADLLIGAISFANRSEGVSSAKADLVSHIEKRSGTSLKWGTSRSADKFNLFRFTPGGLPQ